MNPEPWAFCAEPSVEKFIAEQDAIGAKAIERAVQRLCQQGDRATEPLVKTVKGEVRELRVKVKGRGLYRIFFFRAGTEFVGFDAYKKGSKKLPTRVRRRALNRFMELTGRQP